jgi:hypothetical protein
MAADEDPAQALARTSNDLPEVPFELPRDPARARSALLELLAGHRNDELILVWSQPKGGGLGAIDVVAQAGLPDRQAVQERCAKDARLEGVLRYEVEFFDSRPQKVALTGAFSPGVLACARGLLLEAAFVHPDDARPVVRGFFGFGSTASEIQTYRSRLTKQLRLTGYSGPSSHRTRAPRVRMGAIKVDGALPPEVIQRIVRQNYGRFRLCYEQGLARKPNLEGRVNIAFVIDKSGEVKGPKNAGSDLPDAAVVRCMVSAFNGISFPQPERGVVNVVYPIMFSPG